MPTKRMRLTKTAVDRLQPAERDYEVADEGLPGLYVRVYVNGSKTVVIRYKAGRRQRRYSIGRLHNGYTFAQARADAAAKLREVRGGDDPSLDRRRRRQAATFAEVAERFLVEHGATLKPRTLANYRALLANHILPALGSMPMEDLQRADVQRLHHRMGKKTKGAANRALSLVSVICNLAEGWGYREGRLNPCRGIKHYTEQPKERYLTADERARLDAVLVASERARKGHPDYVAGGSATAVRLLSLTGARCSEITGLTWPMVDLERGFLRLPDSKTGAKVIPLSRQAIELLRQLQAARQPGVPWVCAGERGGRVQNIQRAWRSIRGRARLEDVRLHDLRHSLASDAAATGASLPVIGKMLGHRNVATTQRYAHLTDVVVRDALDRTGDRIEQQIRDGAAVIDLEARREAAARSG